MHYLILFLLPTLSFANFTNESELSLIQTGGNSKVETFNFKTKSLLVSGKNNYELGGHYVLGVSEDKATEENVESARNWAGYTKYTRDLNEKLGIYSQVQIEGDEFAGFKQRENLDLGGKYTFIKSDKVSFFSELGLRHTIERAVTRDEDGDDVFNYQKGRFYTEYSRKQNESLSYKFWVEYLPNFTDADKYLITFEPSLAVVLSNVFSLKLAYKGVYNNEPAEGVEEYLDYTTTTSIIAKF